jgi:hypothetical protein
MTGAPSTSSHSAEDAALGFYYQAYFAFLTLLGQLSDNASVGLERLDDVELKVDGHLLLYQLKHSIKLEPPPITLKSRALWKTLKVWVDILPNIELSETTLHLIAVGKIPEGSALNALTAIGTDREDLVSALAAEAETVLADRTSAKAAGLPLPHGERAPGCEAFLSLSPGTRLSLVTRALIKSQSPNIAEIEEQAQKELTIIHVDHRAEVVKRLLGWWDTEIIHALCQKRAPFITRTELQAQIVSAIGDLENGKLQPEFELQMPPGDYQPDGMLARQIKLVEGGNSDLSKAIREEWRAREQRGSWLVSNPAMGSVVNEYDRLLEEEWRDRYNAMVEACEAVSDQTKRQNGLELLRWTHDEAPGKIRPVADGWTATYYVRGTYQVLAIDLRVGWHPAYTNLLKGDE